VANRVRGRDSDFFILHQTYTRLVNSNKKHIDLNRVLSKPIIQNGVFECRYRTTDLDSVSQALLGVGKYGKLNAGTFDISSLPVEEQERYVRRDTELAMLLAQYNNCLALYFVCKMANSKENLHSLAVQLSLLVILCQPGNLFHISSILSF